MGNWIAPPRHASGGPNEWFRDFDGVWTKFKRYDEVIDEFFDFTDDLDSGETISSVTGEANGVSYSSIAAASPLIGITALTGGPGYVDITITTSSSREYQERFRWRCPDNTSSDYRP
jgi:hypothetical protein